jgi:hypothetical protein
LGTGEWLRGERQCEDQETMRRVIIGSVLVLFSAAVFAHDHNHPENNDWLKSLHSQNKTWCCNGDDTDAIEDWEARGSRYRVKFKGQWFDVPESAIVDGPNKGGDALLWMNKGVSGMSVRCFMPGTLT